MRLCRKRLAAWEIGVRSPSYPVSQYSSAARQDQNPHQEVPESLAR